MITKTPCVLMNVSTVNASLIVVDSSGEMWVHRVSNFEMPMLSTLREAISALRARRAAFREAQLLLNFLAGHNLEFQIEIIRKALEMAGSLRKGSSGILVLTPPL